MRKGLLFLFILILFFLPGLSAKEFILMNGFKMRLIKSCLITLKEPSQSLVYILSTRAHKNDRMTEQQAHDRVKQYLLPYKLNYMYPDIHPMKNF